MCGSCHDLRKKEKRPHIKRTKEYMIEYNKKRYSKIHDRITRNVRKRISQCLKKNKKTVKYLDCEFSHFKKWIEFQFDKNMNWQNYGEYWHLDHVIPCNSFDFTKEEDIKECFNWKNYRPLEGLENIIKGDKIIKSVINKQKKLVKKFLTETSNSIASE